MGLEATMSSQRSQAQRATECALPFTRTCRTDKSVETERIGGGRGRGGGRALMGAGSSGVMGTFEPDVMTVQAGVLEGR